MHHPSGLNAGFSLIVLSKRLKQPDRKLELHLCGEHGDVMKLPSSSLFDGNSQEESAAVFGEHGLLVLQKDKMQKTETFMVQCKSDFPNMSDFYSLLLQV